ncbi:MAG: hypothetical protein IJW18_05080 [Lachnospiraceae bacterium]|nr:hypothetical protein [Lachnospiraceae bacterium]
MSASKRNKGKELLKKIIITLVSVLIMGIALSVLGIIDEGMDSFTYMNISISDSMGWSLGNWEILLNVILFIPVIIWGRKHIGLGTLFNMTLVGYTIDVCSWFWSKTDIAKWIEILPLRIAIMLVAVAIFVFAAAFYMSTDLGTSPCDALPMMFSERFIKIPFKLVRFLWDAILVLIGFIFSGKVGIVTILMVLFLGQTIALVRNWMRRGTYNENE